MRDVVDRLDELLAFAGAIGGTLTAKRPPKSALGKELHTLFQKVLYHKEKDKLKAVDFVAHEEGLNKKWTKELKKYVKKYYK